MSFHHTANVVSRRPALKIGSPIPDPHIASSVTIVSLWKSLEKFSEKLENFFERGFEGSPPILEFSPDYSSRFVFRTISEQIGHDMELLHRALGQRIIYHKPEQMAIPSESAENFEKVLLTLKVADWIAYHIALKPAIRAGFLPPTTVVTYFEKSLNSRVVPYAPVALIGFPFRNIGAINKIMTTDSEQIEQSTTQHSLVFGDLLAIPHEVGHYVYWHSSAHGSQLSHQLHRYVLGHQPQWILNWLEELYADIYGYVIAGPVAALQLMEMLRSGSKSSLLFDDGQHPIPVLRIYAAVDALEGIGLLKSAKSLEETWSSWVRTQIHEDEFHPAQPSAEPIKLVDARRIIKEVIQTMIALDFIELRSAHRMSGTPDFWLALNNETNLVSSETQQNLLEFYSNKFNEVIDTIHKKANDPCAFTVPQLVVNGDTLCLVPIDKTSTKHQYTLGDTATWIDVFLQMTEEQTPSSASTLPTPLLPVQVWMAVLEAGGWITGPHGSIIQPKSTPSSKTSTTTTKS